MQVKVKQEYIPETQISISSSSQPPSRAFMTNSPKYKPTDKNKQQKEYKHKIKRDKQNKGQNKNKQEREQNVVNLLICYQDMVKIAEQNVRFFQHSDFWKFGELGQKQYWRKVLVQLLVGYQEVQLNYNMQKVLTGKQSTTHSNFLKQYPTLLTAVPYLLQKSKQIQQQVLKSTLPLENKPICQIDQQHQIHLLSSSSSSSSSSSCSSPLPTTPNDNQMHKSIRYDIQMGKIIRQLSDADNVGFRESVVVGRYGVEDIGVMDQIDMMDSRKRQYMHTKKKSYLDSSMASQQKRELQKQYLLKLEALQRQKWKYDPQLQILEIKRSNADTNIDVDVDVNVNINKQTSTMRGDNNVNSIKYWLSDKYVQKLQCRLMAIPMRDTRKYLLLQLRQLCL